MLYFTLVKSNYNLLHNCRKPGKILAKSDLNSKLKAKRLDKIAQLLYIKIWNCEIITVIL